MLGFNGRSRRLDIRSKQARRPNDNLPTPCIESVAALVLEVEMSTVSLKGGKGHNTLKGFGATTVTLIFLDTLMFKFSKLIL